MGLHEKKENKGKILKLKVDVNQIRSPFYPFRIQKGFFSYPPLFRTHKIISDQLLIPYFDPYGVLHTFSIKNIFL